MFTGIIQDIGTLRSVTQNGDWRLVIETGMNLSDTQIGASIACSGCCLTVVSMDGNSFAADVSAETLSKTVIGQWQEGQRINLEPALRFGDELGGHLVSGHVDGIAVIESITPDGDSHRFKIRAPQDLARFIAPKGSITLDGISLTVNEVEGTDDDCVFGINIVPHTWENTTLGLARPGDALNIEIDMLARYVARLLNKDQS